MTTVNDILKAEAEASPAPLPGDSLDRRAIYMGISLERIRQDKQWGGSEHDDQHALEDWCLYIEYQLERCNGVGGPEYRDRMVKVAALAVAAIESWDRVYANAPQPSTQMQANASLSRGPSGTSA